MNILAVNAGSSSLKFSLHSGESRKKYRVSFTDDGIEITLPDKSIINLENPQDSDERYILAFKTVVEKIEVSIDAIAHRVVHGGDRYDDHQVINDDVIAYLKSLIPFAPLHQPFNVKLIELCAQLIPNVRQIACFDTQFHQTIPDYHRRYALPDSAYQNGEKAYGFHGLSYDYISDYFTHEFPEYAEDNILVAHIGSGASLCGLKAGKSYISSMGFSTLEGLPMSSRCGHIDPGLILYWLERGDSLKTIEQRLYKESGLLGLSGISSDYQVLLHNDQPQAAMALDIFTRRIHQQMASVMAGLGGIQHLVFTAGIGENAAEFRATMVALLAQWLPITLDNDANTANAIRISGEGSKIQLWVIPTNEEQVMIDHAQRLIAER